MIPYDMRIFGRDILDSLTLKHGDTRRQIAIWIMEVEKAIWNSPLDIKARYSDASILSGDIVIFNIKGNRYRIKAQVSYELKVIEVLFAGTHAEYDKHNKGR